MTSSLLSCTKSPFEKEAILKGKNLFPLGKFFHFTIDPFKEGRQIKFDRVFSLESVYISSLNIPVII